jgi:acetyl-CoA decarbonylase/synthase complex subunit beta
MYTGFGYPHTSCGCFEAIAFYIPEVEGYGIVDRGYRGVSVNGLAFSTLADSTSGGRQVDGFHGLSIEYMRSPKFMSADGGWDRIVWLPKEIKERVKEFIPADVVDKLATEEEAKTIDELKEYLQNKDHPVVQRWTEDEAEEETEEAEGMETMGTMVPMSTATMSAGGFKIIFKNAKIHAEKIIIKREKSKSKRR